MNEKKEIKQKQQENLHVSNLKIVWAVVQAWVKQASTTLASLKVLLKTISEIQDYARTCSYIGDN